MNRPTVAHTELYSYLVTRHTGRTVRASIERELAELDRAALAVLDLRHVPLIDFSCADEIVAKLVTLAAAAQPHRRFVLFRGVADHHREPIERCLARQGLAAAAESVEGEPLLLGEVDPAAEAVWKAVWTLGRVAVSRLAEHVELSTETAASRLDDLEARGLLIRDGEVCLSLERALRDAQGGPGTT
ncbi:MAG: hypothetical protein R3266_13930 [Gemmatimonadota bacterium]|nr:hypothetical protein [Gemmatimonadota bacterium]